jgi:hypothetical protein
MDQRSYGATADRGGNGADYSPPSSARWCRRRNGALVGLGVIADNLINIGRKRQGSLNKPVAIIGF